MESRWKVAFGLALLNDFIDLLGIGSIPLLGDVLDAISSIALWKTLGTKYTAPTLLEFIPGLDVLPIYTVTVSYAYIQKQKEIENKRDITVE